MSLLRAPIPRYRWLLLLLGAVASLVPVVLAAQPVASAVEDNYFLERPDSNKFALILTGPSVGEDSSSQFRQWSFSLHDILVRDYGYTSDSVSLLMESVARAGSGGERVDGICDRAGIESELDKLKTRMQEGDQLTIFLLGHGSGRDAESKFNIVGPDITGGEFATMLDAFDAQDLVIVNTTSASYGFSESLSSEGRIVISATRSPAERYDPVFSRYFIEALDNRNGDRDKNSRVSMLEAFIYARQSVEQWYEDQGRLASEHASLDDNGDAMFTLNPTASDADGRLAEIAYIDALGAADTTLSAEARARQARMQELERAVFILRGRKDEYLEADYWERLETLLVELARATELFDEAP